MLSQETQNLIEKYQLSYKSSQIKSDVPFISVDEVASKVAGFYEKIKGVVDWREEHLLRKRAIERILKRKMILQEKNETIAEPLVYELIRGGHFSNNSIPETKIQDIQKILNKYFFILDNSPENIKITKNKQKNNGKSKIQDWLLNIASYEIEKTLSSTEKQEALTEYMTDLMEQRIKISQGAIAFDGMTEQEKNIQIYIAALRALLKFDEPTIIYYLILKQYPEWNNLSTDSPLLLEIAKKLFIIQETIIKQLKHPLSENFFHICKQYNTSYLILDDIITQDAIKAKENLENPETLENLIKKSYSVKLIKLKSKIKRAALYSTISIFLTKIGIALAIEVPVEKYLTGDFNVATLWINILLPPFLMLLLVISIKPPKKENLDSVIMEIMKIVYQKQRKNVYEIKARRKKTGVLNTIISIIYCLTFIVSFVIIYKILQYLNFSAPSMAIFIFYFSIISFLGVKIRESSKELTIKKEKETIIFFILDFFTLPVLQMGRWFSKELTKFNIGLFITILIDMPFSFFLEFLEQWRYFLKEKKQKIH
ncbi:MAG: hypothetical protein U9Q27_00805 [Patescibacteria group bacterium]|nr:hypothetical protein [Patescibacteria group bacterium]